MAETIASLATPETDTKALREALLAQQQLLQKLYAELDKEREASASAASEALSMILRLQGEKAALSMEASQYRRMAEEKMGHAEESLSILEDVMIQKEMQIWSLEYQIQAYKSKLLSLGVTEDDFPKGSVPQENGAASRDGGENCIIRRLKSMPAMALKDLYKTQSAMEKEVRGVADESEPEAKRLVKEKNLEVVENLGSKDLKSYWEQIRELDEHVKEISKAGLSSSYNLGRTEKEASDAHPSSTVLDIFEVPETGKNGRASWPSSSVSKGQGRLLVEEGNRLGKPDLVLVEEILKSPSKTEAECKKRTVINTGYDENQCNAKEWAKVECGASLVCLKADVAECQSHLQQLRQRVEQLEDDRNTTRDEIREAEEEDRNTLREIMEQLNSIQSEMQSLRPKKPSSQDNVCLPLKEAMLHFWL